MKTAIVTFVRAYNYGAVLQCYALSKAMNDLGYETAVIDYDPDYFRRQYTVSYFNAKSLPKHPNKMWLVYAFLRLIVSRRNYGFQRFINAHIPVTPEKYYKLEDLNRADLDYDAYVSGSDQVWSHACVPFDPVYFLCFPSAANKIKASYAASFGFLQIPEKLRSEYANRLRGWDRYSVREDSAADILSDLLDISPTICCDPTLLLSKDQWNAVRKHNLHRRPYILIYRVGVDNTALLDYAEKLAKLKHMDVLTLSSSMYYDHVIGFQERARGFHHWGHAAPDQWLGLFAEASYVLTDSFHGLVFSIINHKQFLLIPNFRAEGLMRRLGIENRSLSDDLSAIDAPLDWDKADCLLEAFRLSSLNYLKSLADIDYTESHK